MTLATRAKCRSIRRRVRARSNAVCGRAARGTEGGFTRPVARMAWKMLPRMSRILASSSRSGDQSDIFGLVGFDESSPIRSASSSSSEIASTYWLLRGSRSMRLRSLRQRRDRHSTARSMPLQARSYSIAP